MNEIVYKKFIEAEISERGLLILAFFSKLSNLEGGLIGGLQRELQYIKQHFCILNMPYLAKIVTFSHDKALSYNKFNK